MASEIMTSEERLWAAIQLEKPDRVPIALVVDRAASAQLLGLKSHEIAAQGFDVALETAFKAFDAFGGWDAFVPPIPPESGCLTGMKMKYPTETSPEHQIIEEEVWTPEEYELLTDVGMNRFIAEHLVFRVSDLSEPEQVKTIQDEYASVFIFKFLEELKKRNAALYFFAPTMHPFFWLSMTRSMNKFTEDLYYRPDIVERAMKVLVNEYIEVSIDFCEKTNTKIAPCVEERAGGYFYPLHIFERFWWPYTRDIVDAFWSRGIVTLFHLDTCWDKNLGYFKQLPKGSAILDFDGTTDIFAAKEELGGHLCIGGDVHPALLSLGRPEEVEAYCRKLIDEVGGEGGFLLAAGCSVPAAVKPENFKAMIQAGKTYELSKK